MEVTLSKDCMETLATLIAEKLSAAKVEKLVGIQDLSNFKIKKGIPERIPYFMWR